MDKKNKDLESAQGKLTSVENGSRKASKDGGAALGWM